jgi:hypothetical protein
MVLELIATGLWLVMLGLVAWVIARKMFPDD